MRSHAEPRCRLVLSCVCVRACVCVCVFLCSCSVTVEQLMRANHFFTRDELHTKKEIKVNVLVDASPVACTLLPTRRPTCAALLLQPCRQLNDHVLG